MNKKVVIIGAGGHAKSIGDIVLKCNDILLGFLDDNIDTGTIILKEKNIKVIGSIQDINTFSDDVYFIIGIGNNNLRKTIANKYNLKYYTAIHPNSNIGEDVRVGEGTAIMANTSINVSTIVGKHCVINTGAIVEHDNVIEDFVHLSPNSALSGTVKIGNTTHIGTGANIKNNLSVASDVIVGVGGVVVKDINEKGIYIGVPVRKMRKNEEK